MTTNNTTANSTALMEPATVPTSGQSDKRKATGLEHNVAQPRASKSLEYRGHKVRFHVDADGCPWFILVDIFRALGTFKKAKLRAKIQDRSNIKEVLAWIPNCHRLWESGDRMVQAANLTGIAAMATYKTVPETAEFLARLQGEGTLGVAI